MIFRLSSHPFKASIAAQSLLWVAFTETKFDDPSQWLMNTKSHGSFQNAIDVPTKDGSVHTFSVLPFLAIRKFKIWSDTPLVRLSKWRMNRLPYVCSGAIFKALFLLEDEEITVDFSILHCEEIQRELLTFKTVYGPSKPGECRSTGTHAHFQIDIKLSNVNKFPRDL